MDAPVLAALHGLLDALDPPGVDALRAFAAAITPLGGTPVLAAIVALAAGGLAWRGRRAEAAWLVATCVLGWALMHGLKLVVGRPRPDVAGHLVAVVGASFPSGHAMMSTVVTASLALLAERGTRPRTRAGTWAGGAVLTVAVLMLAAIGASRVLLGVHWPTDVLAGWGLGAAWTAAAWTLYARGPFAARRAQTGTVPPR